jgi:peptide/nickel transport system substrate-binding protein
MKLRLTALLAAAALLLALPAAQAQAPAPQRGGTIRVGITQEIVNLDPHLATAFSSFQILDLVYESLLRLDPRTLKLEPNLAQSWTVSPNGLEYTFTLRRDVTFHDGSALDASDVKATIDRILDPETKSPQASFLAVVREVTVVNPFVVRITLRQPSPSFLSLLTNPGRGIVPANFTDKVGDARVKTLGTGPYMLAEFGPGSVRLVRYERYWRKDAQGIRLPYADSVVYRVIPDAATLRAAVRAGEVDMIIGFGVDITAARALQGVPGLRIMSVPDLSYSLVGINAAKAPFSDVRVRQAMSLATDREQIVQVVYGGRATVGGPVPPTLEEWRPIPARNLPFYRRDVARARALLQQAGVALPLAVKMMPIPTVPDAVQMAQVLKEQWAPAGLTVELEQVDFATFLSRWRGSQFDTFVSLNGGSPDPDLHLYRHIHSTGSTNVFKFKDATVDQLLDQGRATADPARRVEIYARAQRAIAEAVPFLFIAYADLFAVRREQLQGFVLSSTRSMAPLAESWLAR